MTPSPSFWPFKKIAENWLESNKKKLEQVYKKDLAAVQEEYDNLLEAQRNQVDTLRQSILEQEETLSRKKEDVESLQTRVSDRQAELARLNEDLKTQIRLIEAKAAPDTVWTSAFSLGFSKAWDMMLPLMNEGFANSRKVIEDKAISATLAGLEPHILRRLEEAGKLKLKSANELLAKKLELSNRIQLSKDKNEIKYLECYLTALDWILDADKKSN